MSAADALDAAAHRRIAVDLFNGTWALIDKADRTPAEVDRMIHMAHASRLHWELAGGSPSNLAVGEWQIARVYSVLGRAEPALHHARRCLEINQQAGSEGFFLGSAHEGMARAFQVAGNLDAAREHCRLASEICASLPDKEDQQVLKGDLGSIPLG